MKKFNLLLESFSVWVFYVLTFKLSIMESIVITPMFPKMHADDYVRTNNGLQSDF